MGIVAVFIGSAVGYASAALALVLGVPIWVAALVLSLGGSLVALLAALRLAGRHPGPRQAATP